MIILPYNHPVSYKRGDDRITVNWKPLRLLVYISCIANISALGIQLLKISCRRFLLAYCQASFQSNLTCNSKKMDRLENFPFFGCLYVASQRISLTSSSTLVYDSFTKLRLSVWSGWEGGGRIHIVTLQILHNCSLPSQHRVFFEIFAFPVPQLLDMLSLIVRAYWS